MLIATPGRQSPCEGVGLHLAYHKGLYAPLISWLVFALHDIINAVDSSGVKLAEKSQPAATGALANRLV
jgi:hypothetical protein